jgi:hypothetical protein
MILELNSLMIIFTRENHELWVKSPKFICLLRPQFPNDSVGFYRVENLKMSLPKIKISIPAAAIPMFDHVCSSDTCLA